MRQRDIDLLAQEGWEVVCESPFEIYYKENEGYANGRAADLILGVIQTENEGKLLKKEYRAKIDGLSIYLKTICPTPTFERQEIINILYSSIEQNYGS